MSSMNKEDKNLCTRNINFVYFFSIFGFSSLLALALIALI